MKILRWIKCVIICGIPILFYHFFYMCRYAKHPNKYPFEKRYKVVRREIRFVFKHFRCDYKMQNFDMFTNNKEKFLILCNHLSDADPLVLIATSEKPLTFVCKKEVLDFPFVGKIAKALECFPLDRENLMNQISQIRDIVSFLKDPTKPSVLIFIEGARNRHPENNCLEFHPGTLKIAQMANVPVLCSAMYGSFRILSKTHYSNKYPIFFNFFRRMEVSEMKEYKTTDLAPILEKQTNLQVDLFRDYDKEYIYALNNSKARKQLETRFDVRVNS